MEEVVGHYRIMKKLGQGGMGVVYLAEDTRLARKVALKILPAEFVRDAERLHRFQLEARVISALNHPNILTIFEVGLGDAGHFIATEFIEGETIRQLLDRQLPDIRQILDISVQVTAALTAAHEAGIVHRDIKPENIMVRTDGYVKILDFGLAKPVHRPDGNSFEAQTVVGTLTSPGMVMGTVKYMSPEQARGQELDARTDLFSFGVVLYEMSSGCLPFQGGTPSDTLAAILLQDPPPLNVHARNTRPELQSILIKALSKKIEERYGSAREFGEDLKELKRRLEIDTELGRSGETTRIGVPPVTTGRVRLSQGTRLVDGASASIGSLTASGALRKRKSRAAIDSIAVLPLQNASPDPGADYLSDGITESIINSLSRLPKLKVMARSTVFRYKGPDVDPLAAGTELGVRAVLSGRMVLMGENLVIKTELVDVTDGTQLWGEQYKRKFSDIFEIEEQISSEIFEKLKGKLTGEEKKKLVKRSTEDTAAYQLFLKGRFHWNKRTGEGLERSLEHFRQAIALDPNYAMAYVGTAEASVLQAWFGFGLRPPREVMPIARSSALRALELDSGLAEAHASLALVRLLYDWDWAGAESEFQKAIELKPGYVTAHHWYPILLTAAGRFDEALKETGVALEIDPLSLIINATAGWIKYYARRYDEAAALLRKTIEMDSSFPTAHWLLGYALEAQAKYDEAIVQFEEARSKDATPATLSSLGHALAVAGRPNEALGIVETLDRMSLSRYVSPDSQGVVFAALGDFGRAFECLEKAVQDRSSYLIYINVDPRLDPLRSDPRFEQLLLKTNVRNG